VTVLFDIDHWQEVLQSLRRNKLRTILTACGVFWGVFMLVVMLGFARGLEKAATGDFANFAVNAVFIWGDRTAKPYAGQQPGRRVFLTNEDAEAISARIKGVQMVAPRNQGGGRWSVNAVTRKEKTESFGLSGELPEFPRLENIELEKGRFIDPDDMAERRKVIVIGKRVQDLMFEPRENPIGDSLHVGGVEYTIIGVYRSPMATGNRADWANGRIFIPRTTFARSFGTSNRADYLTVLVAPGYNGVEVEEEIRALLKSRHRVDPQDERGVGSFNAQKEVAKIRGLFLGINGLSWVVGVLTLLAGAIGVSNIMMITVSERTKEIGIRKAIGATPSSIMFQIVQESVVLTALAGYLGLVVGVGVVEIAAHFVEASKAKGGPSIFSSPEVDLSKAVVAAVLLTVAGALAGLAPARSAVAVRPVEALAHE
jgi:putative ABC transport system permease protein